MKFLCLHGFLGSPTDFDFLKSDYEIYAPDLSQLVDLSFEKLYEKISQNIDLKEYHILGYSFGARLAARLYVHFQKNNSSHDFKKLFCLAGHLGLDNSKLIDERKKVEEKFLNRIKMLSEVEFIRYWNNLELFKNDEKLKEINFSNASKFFKNYALSNQPYLKEELLVFKEHVTFFYGEKDTKYASYAKSNLKEFNINFMKESGHRVLNDKMYLLQKIGEVLCN